MQLQQAKYWMIDMLVNALMASIIFAVIGIRMHADQSVITLLIGGGAVGALLAFSLRCFGGRLVWCRRDPAFLDSSP
jgi:O-antigen ligase